MNQRISGEAADTFMDTDRTETVKDSVIGSKTWLDQKLKEKQDLDSEYEGSGNENEEEDDNSEKMDSHVVDEKVDIERDIDDMGESKITSTNAPGESEASDSDEWHNADQPRPDKKSAKKDKKDKKDKKHKKSKREKDNNGNPIVCAKPVLTITKNKTIKKNKDDPNFKPKKKGPQGGKKTLLSCKFNFNTGGKEPE